MLAIVVMRAGEPTWRKTFVTPEVQIGSGPENAVVLADPRVAKAHARVVMRDGKHILVDLKTEHGTFVDGRRLTTPLVIKEHYRIALGGYTLQLLAMHAEVIAGATVQLRAPIEQALLEAITRGDDASRLVYADWLEGTGDHVRAEFLRLQQSLVDLSPEDPVFEARTDRLRELAAMLDLAWRSRIAQRTIEACPAFDFRCPKQWSALAATDREGVRHCGSCRKDVYYCGTVEEARGYAAEGACVALDVTSPRWSNDLDAPFGLNVCPRCEVDVGVALSRCPRCGERVEQDLVMGLMA